MHRYRDGRILALDEQFNKKMRSRYGAPFLGMHRADLQKLLYKKACALGVQVRLGARVECVRDNSNTATVTLGSSKKLTADLIVGADGLWSKCRENLIGYKDPPLPTGDLAYRIVLTLDQITDPDLRAMVANPGVNFWIGPFTHAVAYSLRHGEMYNIVLLCPDDLPESVVRQPGSVEEMRMLFADWDPILKRFLDQVDRVDKWRLMHRAEMDSWSSTNGRVVLIGDSCHPMLPYLAQGANSSIEDGAALGRILGSMPVGSNAGLRNAITIFEKVRKQRSEAIARETFAQRNAFHLPDGEEQAARDKVFLSQLGSELESTRFPFRWYVKLRLAHSILTDFRTCPIVQPWLYGYNAFAEADAAVVAFS